MNACKIITAHIDLVPKSVTQSLQHNIELELIIVVCQWTNHKEAQYADKVFFRVADPVCEVYIKDLFPDALDLYVFYADDKEML